MASKNLFQDTPFHTKQPLNTPGGLGKEIKGNMQGTNILKRLEDDYRGQMTDGKMFEDDIDTRIRQIWIYLTRTLEIKIGNKLWYKILKRIVL